MTKERRQAVLFVLFRIRNPLTLMNRPEREDVLKKIEKYNITAKELAEMAYDYARRI